VLVHLFTSRSTKRFLFESVVLYLNHLRIFG
jgi:hypothetical protein